MSKALPNEGSTDVGTLSQLITLRVDPVAVVWRRKVSGDANSQIPGPTDWQLEALLTFAQDDAEQLTVEARKLEKPRDVGSIDSIDWLPAEDRQKFEALPASSKYKAKGEAYSAADFAKPPLSQGYLIRLPDSPKFFLKLYTQ